MVAGPCSGTRRHESVVDLVDERKLPGLGLVPLAVPSPELAVDVALAAAKVTQADGIGVDRVDAGEHVDERRAAAAGGVA